MNQNMDQEANKDRLDAILSETLRRDAAVTRADEAAAARVLARLSTLPRQKLPFWRLPGVLLDWQFAPAWPRMAALAGCAVIGFAIGLTGVDRASGPQGSPYSFVSGADFGSSPFEPSGGTQ
jgi:hypothetical protein